MTFLPSLTLAGVFDGTVGPDASEFVHLNILQNSTGEVRGCSRWVRAVRHISPLPSLPFPLPQHFMKGLEEGAKQHAGFLSEEACTSFANAVLEVSLTMSSYS